MKLMSDSRVNLCLNTRSLQATFRTIRIIITFTGGLWNMSKCNSLFVACHTLLVLRPLIRPIYVNAPDRTQHPCCRIFIAHKMRITRFKERTQDTFVLSDITKVHLLATTFSKGTISNILKTSLLWKDIHHALQSTHTTYFPSLGYIQGTQSFQHVQ